MGLLAEKKEDGHSTQGAAKSKEGRSKGEKVQWGDGMAWPGQTGRRSKGHMRFYVLVWSGLVWFPGMFA